MKCLNLIGVVFLITLANVSSISLSRLDLILVHWDSFNATGSYFKVKNNPSVNSIYTVNISSKYLDNSNKLSSGFTNYSITVTHDNNGLASIELKWPSDFIGTEVNIMVREEPNPHAPLPDFLGVSVSLHSSESAPSTAGVYYPRDTASANISMLKVSDNTWRSVWENSEENWLVNLTNPQQVELDGFAPSASTVFCFVCKHGLTSTLGNYTLTLFGASNVTFSLLAREADSAGLIRVDHNTTIDATSFIITYSMNVGGTLRTREAAKGLIADVRRTDTYLDVFIDGPLTQNVYLNEIHFPRLNGTKAEDKQYWIEIIGDPLTDLSNYCISMVEYKKDIMQGIDRAATPCLSPTEPAQINSNGYYIWTISGSTSNIRRYLSNTNASSISIYLYRAGQVSYKLIDEFNFRWYATASPEDEACFGVRDFYCLNTESAKCDTLCLSMQTLLEEYGKGVSRCGIQKDPALKDEGAKMSVWYISEVTRKVWNECKRPIGYLKRVDQPASKVTVSLLRDSRIPSVFSRLTESLTHLPNMGLMFMFWNYHPNGEIVALPPSGVDLTLDSSASLYPMTEINITITKSEEPLRNGTEIKAKGGSFKTLVLNSVYAVGIIQYYHFLPPFNVSIQSDQVVDAVVFSSAGTKPNLPMVTTFLDMSDTEQGQLILKNSANPILERKNPVTQRSTDNWHLVLKNGSFHELEKLYVTSAAQHSIRIDRIGNNKSPYVDLRLVNLPKEYKSLYAEKGVPLERMCLVVTQVGPVWRRLVFKKLGTYHNLKIDGRAQRINLTAFDYPTDQPIYVLLFRDNNATHDVCLKPFTIASNTVDGDYPAEDITKNIVDSVRLGYDYKNGSHTFQGEQELIRLVMISDGSEAVRCNSMLPFYNPAFSVVSQGERCPVPSQFYIYKMCQHRMGIAREGDEPYSPFATDYLHLYQLNDQNRIVNITSLVDSVHLLKWKFTVINTPTFSLKSDAVASFGLGWFPYPDVPHINDTIVNHTLNVIVVYPNDGMQQTAKTRLAKILDTAEHHDAASRPIAMFLPYELDLRHCLFGCERATAMVEMIDYETNQFNMNDEICNDPGFTTHYKKLRINEININVKGFRDEGEYIELIGPPDFRYSGGVSIAVLNINGKGMVNYQRITHIIGNADHMAFDHNGFFIFHHNKTAAPATMAFNILRYMPDDFGAVALLWGAQLVSQIVEHSPVLEEHVNMPDLFLDVVIYANNQSTSHSLNVQKLVALFSPKLHGNVAIETLGIESYNETISRCFCNDTWNMDCFEMSFTETEQTKNVCPTQFRENLTFCMSGNVENPQMTIRDHIDKFMTDSAACRQESCSFSKYQVTDFSSCVPDEFKDENKVMWSFVIGFPTQIHLTTLGSLISVEHLTHNGDNTFFECGHAVCPVTTTKAPAPKSHKAAIIGGVVAGVIVILIIVVIVLVVLRKRQKQLRNLSARFEANIEEDEDDDTFLPNGKISFSNPRYNQTNGNGSNGSSKTEYQKLSQST